MRRERCGVREGDLRDNRIVWKEMETQNVF
jgi:hypothetical protein